MKRLLALFLTGALTLSLFGCAQNAQSVSGTTTTTESAAGNALSSEEAAEEAVETAAEETAAEEPAAEETAAEETTVEEAAEAENTEAPAEEEEKQEEATPEENADQATEAEVSEAPAAVEGGEVTEEQAEDYEEAEAKDEAFEPGTVNATTYTQSHFGFKVTLEEPWVYASADELAAQNQIIIDAAGDDSVREAVEKGNLYVDMVATNQESFNTLMVRIVKMGLADFFLDEDVLYEAYADAIHQDAVSTGLTDIEDVSGNVTFLGESVRYVGVKGQLAVTDDYSTEMWYNCILRQEGTYACLIFFSGFSEFGGETFEELAARFQPA